MQGIRGCSGADPLQPPCICGETMAGRITALRYQKKNRERVNVYLDGHFAFGLPAIVAAHLKKGQFLSDAEIAELREQGAIETAHEQALHFLSYRPRSQAEVATYLRRRGLHEDQIEQVIARLERVGLVDDRAFARFWVENREQFRPRGPRALRYELQRKGINAEIIEEALSSVDFADSAYRAAGKKMRQFGRLEEPLFRRKMIDYLARRGFDYDIAQEVAHRCWSELQSAEK